MIISNIRIKKLVKCIFMVIFANSVYSQDSIPLIKSDVRYSVDNLLDFWALKTPDYSCIRITDYSSSDSIYEILFSKYQGDESIVLRFHNNGMPMEMYFLLNDKTVTYKPSLTFHINGTIESERYVFGDSIYYKTYLSNGKLHSLKVMNYNILKDEIGNTGREVVFHTNGEPRIIKLLDDFEANATSGNQVEIFMIDTVRIKRPFISQYDSVGNPLSLVKRIGGSDLRIYSKNLNENLMLKGRLKFEIENNVGYWRPYAEWVIINKEKNKVHKTKMF